MSRKIKISIVLFWVVLIASFLYWLNSIHWNVYENSEYGFSVSIPEGFKMQTDQYSINTNGKFDFSVTDPEGYQYLGIRAYSKPDDYKDPIGPFPKSKSSEVSADTTNPYVLNGISGFRIEGELEGGGGSFDYFEFVHNEKVWNIEFFAEERNHPEKTFDESVYKKIRNSFKLTQ